MIIPELSSFEIRDFSHFLELLKKVNLNKSIEATIFNKESSRSHTIYKIFIEEKETKRTGLVNIIDLAGSEKYSREQMKKLGISNDKIQKIAKEAININQSLVCLRKVFQVLMENRFKKGEE